MEENEVAPEVTEKKKKGGYPNGEEAASKTAAPKGVEGSNPLPSAQKVEGRYKLNLYRPNGQLRAEISKALFFDLSKHWGDLMRLIPSNRWSTVEEIVQIVWEWEKKQYRKSFTRSRKQIEEGINQLVISGVLLQK
jgi:hypothetical protein